MVDVTKYQDLTYKIIGCAFQVQKNLGNGFQEVLFQRALEIEMKLNALEFEREKSMDIFYKGHLLGKRRSDFLFEEK